MEITRTETLSKAFSKEIPADDVHIDEDEVGDAYVYRFQDVVVDLGLVG